MKKQISTKVSAQQNDNTLGFREASLPRREAVVSRETPLSRADFHGNYDNILGGSAAHLEVLQHINLFAKSSQTVLISGETGTGKELVATALHAQSHRVGQPMVVVNCGGIAEHLIESEFFGHEKGAFTGADQQHIGLFETASGGTLFLNLEHQADSTTEVEYQLAQCDQSYRTLHDNFCSNKCLRRLL